MGGAIGLAVVTTVFNAHVTDNLSQFLPSDQIALLSQSAASIASLPANVQTLARDTFAGGYDLQLKILAGFAGGQILGLALMWQGKGQVRV